MTWYITGNSNIDPTKFLGTTNEQPLIIKTFNTEKMRINPDGNVGIAKTPASGTPYKLDVAGTINATNIHKDGSSLVSSQWTDVSGGINYATGNVGIGKAPSATYKLDVAGTINATDIHKNGAPLSESQWDNVSGGINFDGGNVGIGMVPQATKLSIATAATGGILVDSAATNNVALTLRSSGAGWGSGLQLLNTTATTGRNYGLYAGGDGALRVVDATAGADRLLINPDGRVGIGKVPSSTYKLDVAGTINATGLYKNGSSVVSSQWTGVSGGISYSGGNVGIGTLSPNDRLQIGSGITLHDGGHKVIAFGWSPNSGKALQVGFPAEIRWAPSEGSMSLGTDTSSRNADESPAIESTLTVRGGNVGIGTTTPENSEEWNRVLDVFGDLHAKLSVRSDTVDAQVWAWDGEGWWGARPGMTIGTKSAHALSFATAKSSRMTIDPQGRVGIGTTAPQHGRVMIETDSVPLSLRETGQSPTAGGLWRMPLDAGMWRFDANTAPAGDFSSYLTPLTMHPTGDVGIGRNLNVAGHVTSQVFTTTPGTLHVQPQGGTTEGGEITLLGAGSNGHVTVDNYGGSFRVITQGAERLRVSSNGDVGIGRNLNVAGQLRWGNSVANPDSIELGAPDGSVPGIATPFIDFHFQGLAQDYNTRIINDQNGRLSIVGNLNVTGNAAKPGGGPWAATSDVRLKKGVGSLKDALGKILRLRGVSFEWKNPEKQGNLKGEQMGLVAQEVEVVFPEWISTDPSGYKNVTARGFEALAVEAFKQLKAEFEAENEKLRARIEALELA